MTYTPVFYRLLIFSLLFSSPQLLVAETKGAPQNPTFLGRVFSVHDHDRDGFLNRSEFQEIRRFDKGKGKNRTQQNQRFLQFNYVDTDHDGLVNEDELIEALNRQLKAHRKHRYKSGGYPQ